MRLLVVFLLTAIAGGAAEPVVVSSADTAEHWTGVTPIPDGQAGGAVRFAVPAGRVAACGLGHGHTGYDFTRGGELGFWYRITGTGTMTLFVKVVAYPFADGHQATWQIEDLVADGQWHRATIDLASAWLPWGEGRDMSKSIQFRTDSPAGSNLSLDLDEVSILPSWYAVQVGEGRIDDGRLVASLTVTSLHDEPLRLNLRLPGAEPRTIDLAALATVEAELSFPLDRAAWAALPGLAAYSAAASLGLVGQPADNKELRVTIAKPLELPPGPRILATDAEIAALRDRAGRLPWVAAGVDGVLKNAREWLGKPIELPPRGGQWYHWYADPETGEPLRARSPTEHENPRTGQVFSGYPYDDVYLMGLHNNLSSAMRDLGFAYRYTSEGAFRDKARELLLAYAAKYTGYALHNIHGKEAVGGGRVGPQTLDEAVWLIPVVQGADMIWDTLPEAERREIADGLLRPAADVIRQHKMGIHNIQCWKNSAVGLVGLLLDDSELVADAITSPHGYNAQIAGGVNLDGQWYEGAWGYHWYTMMALMPLCEAGERCGLGLYAYEAEGRSVRMLFDGPLDLAMPDGRLPAFNDSGLSSVTGQTRFYELALARYGDPRYAEILRARRGNSLDALLVAVDELPPPPAEAAGSRLFEAAGYAILRSGDGPGATWLCLKYGPHGGGHGHPDKLNLALYAGGQILGVDPGTARYGVPLQGDWYRTTIAHNTLTVDQASQAPTTGRLLDFTIDQGPMQVAAAEAGGIYAGVTYRRAVALCGQDLVLILDTVTADADRTFDLAWHHAGAWVTPPAGEPVTMPDQPGYRHLEQTVAVTGELPPIKTGEVTARIAVAQPAGGVLWVGHGLGASITERVPCVIARQTGRTAVVGWAIAIGEEMPMLRLADGALEATLAGRTYRLTVPR